MLSTGALRTARPERNFAMELKRVVVAGAAALLMLAEAGFAQQRKVVEFSGSGVPQPNPIPVRGLVKCVGANNPAPADQDMPPWCPAGTQTTMMGRIVVGKWATSDPNTTGDIRWYINFSVDSATFNGSWWGSFILDVPGKGTWEGWFWGESTAALSTYRLIGIGHGGFDQSTFMAEMMQETGKPSTLAGRYLQSKNP